MYVSCFVSNFPLNHSFNNNNNINNNNNNINNNKTLLLFFKQFMSLQMKRNKLLKRIPKIWIGYQSRLTIQQEGACNPFIDAGP